MREIKFRAKREDNGEWIFGCFKDIERKQAKGMYVGVVEYAIKMYDENKYEWVWVDVKTVGQFTGLQDKNRKDIYDGDILKHNEDFENEHNKIIEWESGSFFLGNEHLIDEKLNDWKIIGNKFDNPELLKRD